jgi:hypothetical protein
MEQFFAPIQRIQDQLRPFAYKEVELAVPVEEFLNHRWDWKDMRVFLMDGTIITIPKIAWITEDSFIWIKYGNSEVFDPLDTLGIDLSAKFTAASGAEETLSTVADVDT